MAVLLPDCIAVLASQRFLVLGNTAAGFGTASRAALSYRVLPRRHIANGCFRQR